MTARVDRLLKELGERADAQGIDSLSDVEQTALVPWFTRGVVSNGGFRFFMQYATNGLEDASRRFRALGLPTAADAVEHACELLGVRGREPLDEATRWQLVRGADWEKLDEPELVLYRLSFEGLEAAIEVYRSRTVCSSQRPVPEQVVRANLGQDASPRLHMSPAPVTGQLQLSLSPGFAGRSP